MNKNLLKEMILPMFWLFFFIVYTKIDNKNINLNRQDKSEIRNVTGSAENNKLTNSNSKMKFTKAVYISRY